MPTRLNIQYLLSYLGLIPFFFIILNKYFFFLINEDIFNHFIIYYTIIIIVFIGAINWNLEEKIKIYIAIYGFIPSLFSIIIILLNLYEFNFHVLVAILVLFLVKQLFFDYILVYSKKINKKAYYFLRFPLTIIIITSLLIILL